MLNCGSSNELIDPRPKKLKRIWRIKYDKKVITSPTNAATIMFLADSTPDLSPPEVIHLIPPNTRKAKAIREAPIKAKVITVEKTLPKFSAQRLAQLAVSGHVSIESAAKADLAKKRKLNAGRVRADTFFIDNMIVWGFKKIVKRYFVAFALIYAENLKRFKPNKFPINFIIINDKNIMTKPMRA